MRLLLLLKALHHAPHAEQHEGDAEELAHVERHAYLEVALHLLEELHEEAEQEDVGQAVAEVIEPIRQEKNKLLADKDYLDKVMSNGAERAERLAYRTLNKVYKKVGLVPRKRG
jgi:hypothetical protein